MLNVLSELCLAWPECWDNYPSPACWVKRTLPDSSLPATVSPFELLCVRECQMTQETLVPLMDDSEQSGELDSFVQQR